MNKKINWWEVAKVIITALFAALGGGASNIVM